MLLTSPAPRLAYRLISSQFPPIAIFDKVATARDLTAAFDLSGWTNDPQVRERIDRHDPYDLVFGISNPGIILASFLHVGNNGMLSTGVNTGNKVGH
ncbi:hypothetical protein GCM10019059_42620 [Camelimonas fluminis]|uniref:Uncharacterized protein n=1 Tax=Camelimonas fluminis TaxID=1576911 RepID=A0ABV7UJ75_9HYPH|nr:hypothetical protein [Camelimonas fluminis]GHE79605.1 hypothetical protein GCM10019059_42620 [Camelimonas fluminis]